jgi:hypothetical protein
MRAFDTHHHAHDVQLRVYRQMSPERRAEIAFELSEDVRRITCDGIRQRHPEYSDEDVRRALVALIYGEELARKIWPQAAVLPP